jgi:hypothetical protein
MRLPAPTDSEGKIVLAPRRRYAPNPPILCTTVAIICIAAVPGVGKWFRFSTVGLGNDRASIIGALMRVAVFTPGGGGKGFRKMRKSLWIVPILFAVLLFAGAPSLMADALPFTYTGDTTGAPTYTSAIGVTAHYVTFAFSVDTSGGYTITSSSVVPIAFAIYHDTFDPTKSSTNWIAIIPSSGTTPKDRNLTLTLTSGTPYIIVDAGYSLSDVGPFSTTISGPLGAQLTPITTPEPGTLSLMLIGLGSFGAMAVMRKSKAEGHTQPA